MDTINTQKLVVLHTNDLHSFFEQMPKVATVMNHIRKAYSTDEVLTIDCGDHMDRTRMETEGSSGAANIEVMNYTGYDAVILGNNEGLTFTPDVMKEMYSQYARFKIIGSNMFDIKEGTIPSWLDQYLIIQKGKLRIGMIGVTINFTTFYELIGWDVRDPLEITAQLVRELRDQVDILIVMSHLGLPLDQRMAREIPGIDCIFGGHTHHLLERPLQIGSTYICCAGKFGQHVGKLELHYDFEKHAITFAEGSCIDTAPYECDRELQLLLEKYQLSSRTKLSQVCSKVTDAITIDWHGESPLGNLLADGLRRWTNSEIGMVNAGQLMHHVFAGETTQLQLLEACPSPVNPCRMVLSGKYIKQALEEALLPQFTDLPIRGFGFRGKQLGTLCTAGLDVIYNPMRADFDKIITVLVHGVPLDVNRDYTVGTIDMFVFGVGYLSFTEGKNHHYYLPEFIRDVLRKQLLDGKAIQASRQRHWVQQR